jgi:hypothetical protein
MPNVRSNITALIEEFAQQIVAAIEASAAARVQDALAATFGAPAKRGPGRPKKALGPSAAPAIVRLRARKAPKPTAKLARARKLQGQYLGALRGLGAADRKKVKAVAKAKGVPQALKLAASLKKRA